MTHPWPAGAATGIGSLPGEDPVEAARLVFDELVDLPHLPELPARGAGADMIGRSASLLVDLPVELVPSGWRMTAHPGRDLRRARDLLSWDLDAAERVGDGFSGVFKLQIAGPWTLASTIELGSGHAVVTDHGAARDLAESLREGLRAHLADVASRLPGAQVVVQVDEPGIVAVLAGQVPTPSGYGTVRSVAADVVEQGLRSVLDAVPDGSRIVHCCAQDVPYPLLRAAGANAVSVDASTIGSTIDRNAYDELAASVDEGVALWLGVVPSTVTSAAVDVAKARKQIDRLWHDLGFAADDLAGAVVPTPACGLANATEPYARRVLQAVREIGETLRG